MGTSSSRALSSLRCVSLVVHPAKFLRRLCLLSDLCGVLRACNILLPSFNVFLFGERFRNKQSEPALTTCARFGGQKCQKFVEAVWMEDIASTADT